MIRIATMVLAVAATMASPGEAKERWLEKSGYGLMFHYEAFRNHNPESFNKAVDSFDVKRFGDDVTASGAGHVIFAVGQNWGRYCAPNRAYEKRLNVEPGVWTSKRDLILEIGRELKSRDVRLILYMTARAPMRHYHIIEAMDDTLPTINGKPSGPKVNPLSHPRKLKGFRRSENQAPTAAFLKTWGEVCGEWSQRYGGLVSGWWFDGYKLEMKNAYTPLQKEQHNIDTWVTAVRSGNPEVELAFNAGAHPILSLCTKGRLCPHQTFTSGENHEFYAKTKKGRGAALTPKNFPAPEGVVWHLLLPLSDGWNAGTTSRFARATLRKHIDVINAESGAVTLDIPIAANGAIPAAVLSTLKSLAQERDKLRDGVLSY